MRRMARDVYVSPPADQRAAALRQGVDPNQLGSAMVYLDAKFGVDLDLAAKLEEARAQLEADAIAAQQARLLASARSDEAAAALTELETLQQAQQELATAAAARMGDLAGEDFSLLAEGALLTEESTRRRERLLAAASDLARTAAGGDTVPIVRVEGFQVHAALAPSLQAMLAAARADGIEFGGGGYRSFDAQIATRRNNCGSDDYSIWHKPASQCRPPTARPGTSMHERGLALDLTYRGALITSRSSPGFLWLKDNAARFGLFNLPSEPWHWSTTGG